MKTQQKIDKIIEQAQHNIEAITGKKVILKLMIDAIDIQMIELCKSVCKFWNVEYEWVKVRRRTDKRPIMKQVLLMILEKNFPDARYIDIALAIGYVDHASVHHGLKEGKKLLSIQDPLLMKYYEPVKHFINETELAN